MRHRKIIAVDFGSNPRKVFANEYWDDRHCHIPHLVHPDHKE